MTETPAATGFFLQPMVHVENMSAAVRFYEALGAVVLHGSCDGDFVMLRVGGGGQLGLLAHPANPEQHEGQVELNFETTASLTELETRLRNAGTDMPNPPPTRVSDDSSNSAARTVSWSRSTNSTPSCTHKSSDVLLFNRSSKPAKASALSTDPSGGPAATTHQSW